MSLPVQDNIPQGKDCDMRSDQMQGLPEAHLLCHTHKPIFPYTNIDFFSSLKDEKRNFINPFPNNTSKTLPNSTCLQTTIHYLMKMTESSPIG